MHCTIIILLIRMVLVKIKKFAEKKHKITKGHTGYVTQN